VYAFKNEIMDLTKYVGKKVIFVSGNFEGLKAIVNKLSYDTKYLYGVAMLATLEDGRDIIIEKSEHFRLFENII
jgi:transcription antitermination factor NusG